MSGCIHSVMVQYHALGVLYHIRKADRLAVTKLVGKLAKSHLKSPFAVSLLVNSYRFALETLIRPVTVSNDNL